MLEILSVSCPLCKAAVNKPCRTKSGIQVGAHSMRLRKACKAKKEKDALRLEVIRELQNDPQIEKKALNSVDHWYAAWFKSL
jgi:hypothetical protein